MSLVSTLVESLLGLFSATSEAPVVQWLLRILALSQGLTPVQWTNEFVLRAERLYEKIDGDVFDFIVVGAGSGGATVAARLSEVPFWKVLLIEAGGDPPYASVIPGMFATLAHSESDWDLYARLDKPVGKAHNNSEISLTQGKTLGGGSSINYEIYTRGVPEDYQDWGRIAPGWNWSNVLYYFKKLEGMTDETVLRSRRNRWLHSTNGPVKVSRPKQNKYFKMINERLLRSFEEMEFKRILESNGPDIFGTTQPHFTLANDKRSSTAEAYIRTAKYRDNFYVVKHTRATKLLIEENSKLTYGVEVITKNNKKLNVYISKELIVSAGAINTPKLLMLSGIGPREELYKIGIPVQADLPVGRNLHDHAVVPIVTKGRKGLDTATQSLMTLSQLGAYPVPIQSGLFNLNSSFDRNYRPSFQFFNSLAGAGVAPIMYFGCRSNLNYNNDFCLSIANANTIHEINMALVILLHPYSRGIVTLKSSDPNDEPIVEMGYFRKGKDLLQLSRAVAFMSKLAKTTYFKKVKGEVVKLKVKGCEGIEWDTMEYWVCYTRNTVSTMFHPVGTCAMGDRGVVNAELKVHGVGNLRVVDASVMPTTVSGPTNAPTIMIGERAADLIKMHHLGNFV